jgi:hypothetical protein
MINMKRAATIFVAAMTVAAAGCGGGDSSSPTGPGGGNQLGLYALMTANKKAIPSEIYHGPFFDETIPHFFNQVIVRVTGGELVLQEDDRFHLAIDIYIFADGEEQTGTLAIDGDSEIDGGKIALWADAGGDPVIASIRNGTVTFTSDTKTPGKRTELVFKYVP